MDKRSKVYTYKEQPTDNVIPWRLGEACNEAMQLTAGDYIDRGLGLLKTLEAKGYGIVSIGAASTQSSPAESDKEAVRNAALEDAAKVCDNHAKDMETAPQEPQSWAVVRGAVLCTGDMIRALKSQPAQPSEAEPVYQVKFQFDTYWTEVSEGFYRIASSLADKKVQAVRVLYTSPVSAQPSKGAKL